MIASIDPRSPRLECIIKIHFGMVRVAKPSEVIRCVMVSKARKEKRVNGFFSRVSPPFLVWVRVTGTEVSVVGDVVLCALIQAKG